MDWQGIFEKVIVTVFAGAILGLGGWVLSWYINDPQQVRMEVSWVDVGNPLYGTSSEQRDKIADFIKSITGLNYSFMQNSVKYSDNLRISSIKIQNNSDTKSKTIELKGQSGFFVGGSDVMSFDGDPDKILVRQLNPNETVSVSFVSGSIYLYSNLSGLHDNRSVRVFFNNVDDAIPLYKYFVVAFPFAVFILTSIGVIMILVLLIVPIFSLFIKNKTEWTVKNSSPSSISAHFDVVAYIQNNMPEKVPNKYRGAPRLPAGDERGELVDRQGG